MIEYTKETAEETFRENVSQIPWGYIVAGTGIERELVFFMSDGRGNNLEVRVSRKDWLALARDLQKFKNGRARLSLRSRKRG